MPLDLATAIRLHASREAQGEATSTRLARWGLQLAGLAVGSVLFSAVFLDDLDPTRLSAVVWRVAVIGMAIAGLDAHGTILRSPHRRTLSLLPVDPAVVVRVGLGEVARRAAAISAAAAVLLAPLAVQVGPMAWLAASSLVLGTALLAVPVASLALLGAVDVAERPSWAPLLDAVRGNNPRSQAALLYAFAPLAAIVGGLSLFGADGVGLVARGDPSGWAWVAAPLVLTPLIAPLVPSLARRTWHTATAVLEDIQGQYASIEEAEEARRVYMDFIVRWLPPAVGRWALLDLRYGFRERRLNLSVTWLLAVAALAAAWTDDPAGVARAMQIATLAAMVAGPIVLAQEAGAPPFLRAWLPSDPGPRLAGRVAAVFAWSQAPVWIAAIGGLLRHGRPALVAALWGELCVAAIAAVAAWTAGRRWGSVPFVVATGLVWLSFAWISADHRGGM